MRQPKEIKLKGREYSQVFGRGYKEGANFALYELARKLHIDSRDIRTSEVTVAEKASRLAQRIMESLCNTP